MRRNTRVGDILDRSLVGALLRVVAMGVAGGVDRATPAVFGRVAMLTAALAEDPVARGVAALQMGSGYVPTRAALVKTGMGKRWLSGTRRRKVYVMGGRARGCRVRYCCCIRGWGEPEGRWQ